MAKVKKASAKNRGEKATAKKQGEKAAAKKGHRAQGRDAVDGEFDAGKSDAEEEPAAIAEEVDSDKDEAPVATAEELQAEVSRQSAVLDELFAGPGGRGRGCSAGRGRGRGVGKLLVSRFVPPCARAAAKPPPEPAGPRKAEVNPVFAHVFHGGPRRKEADLPEREEPELPKLEDQGQAEARESSISWLGSLGAEPETSAKAPAEVKEEANPAAQEAKPVEEEVNWLGSLKAQHGVVAESSLEALVAAWAGKALDVAPFWRTESEKKMDEDYQQSRTYLRQRMHRLAYEAKRKMTKQRSFTSKRLT